MVYLPHWPIPYGSTPIKLGLERVKELLTRLHNPEQKLPPIVHIAGTNGKGSTLAYLKTIFECAGYKVHRYISPHIARFNERILLAGEEISDEFLHQVIEETRIAAGDLQTTFFEGTTAAAFLAFSKVKADILLLETGLGGRLDATNVIEEPILSIITPISDDHMEYLGTTISQIANEKAGIIKPNIPCVISWQLKEAMQVILNRCSEKSSLPYACGISWDFEKIEDGFYFNDYANEERLLLPKPSLYGIHQTLNAATAVAAIKQLPQFNISDEQISKGLISTKWPARMERITAGVLYELLPPGWELWVDGAHNNGGAQMIAATVEALWKDKPIYLINGRTGNRDIKAFLEFFKNIIQFVCAVKVQSEPKGEIAANIAREAIEIGLTAYECANIKEAIQLILSKETMPSRILVCGSLYLASDIALANKT